ncbi:unnamed protein product [Mycetohabitans rhizoxinica HKI 454]|uniref:Uncharacterized protein n=1 Tax=Mycetohabitans rhizoxinica (strain DSM 19002 / CIP 109453 / HKI 454) TaxID=882378 RepID=E5ASD6_MYCRK|nr:unnamed protein product [Mycetohabitans rhizoxinica HKI 454]
MVHYRLFAPIACLFGAANRSCTNIVRKALRLGRVIRCS